jgi:hypothetical protein
MCFCLSVFLSVCVSLVSLSVDVSLYPVNKHLFGNPSSEEPGRELKAPELTAAINHSPKPASLEQDKHTPFLHACKQCICRASLNSGGGKKKKNPTIAQQAFKTLVKTTVKATTIATSTLQIQHQQWKSAILQQQHYNTANSTTTTTKQFCKTNNTTTTTTTLEFN